MYNFYIHELYLKSSNKPLNSRYFENSLQLCYSLIESEDDETLLINYATE